MKDVDIEWNMETVAGPHALLTLAESLIRSHRIYVLPSRFTGPSIISLHTCTLNFISGRTNPSI